jgi:hypothetical protein
MELKASRTITSGSEPATLSVSVIVPEVTETEAPVAGVMRQARYLRPSEPHVRHTTLRTYDGRLWARAASLSEHDTAEQHLMNEIEFNFDLYGNDREKLESKIRKLGESRVVIDGNLWCEEHEPRYVVSHKKMGTDRGKLIWYVTTHPAHAGHESKTFNADDFDDMLKHFFDTLATEKDFERICDYATKLREEDARHYDYVKVLIPDAFHEVPRQVHLDENGLNKRIRFHVRDDATMEKAGFHLINGVWSFSRTFKIRKDEHDRHPLELCLWIRYDVASGKLRIDMLDDDFCQPYDWQRMLADGSTNPYALKSRDVIENAMAELTRAKIISGHLRGEYI